MNAVLQADAHIKKAMSQQETKSRVQNILRGDSVTLIKRGTLGGSTAWISDCHACHGAATMGGNRRSSLHRGEREHAKDDGRHHLSKERQLRELMNEAQKIGPSARVMNENQRTELSS
eukprot:GHVN01042905.1.p1 GENE.GHVN01042905.1~~GHVN01042905.1.p1  ORF type:complete len:118 (-),score=10.71 GHVN01042905.1:122-475(-)